MGHTRTVLDVVTGLVACDDSLASSTITKLSVLSASKREYCRKL